MDPLTLSQVNLVLQIIILAMLLTSYGIKRGRKYFAHGLIMLIAVILSVVSFLLVMLPSLLSMEIVKTQPFSMISIVIILHASLGVITGVFAIWLVAAWHLRRPAEDCAKRKMMMRTTLILWLAVLLLGIVVYYFLYGFFF